MSALPCEQDEPVSCETCEDTGWADVQVGEDTKALIPCPDCGGQTPAFIPGHDDQLEGAREGWHR